MAARQTLAQQLSLLNSPPPKTRDPETAYTNLDSHDLPSRQGEEGREHYLDVGPSKLRGVNGSLGVGGDQTLLGERYGGKKVGRMKLFDDDEDEDDDDEDEDEGEGEGGESGGDGASGDGDEDDAGSEEDGDKDGSEGEGEDDEENEEDDDEETEEEDEDGDEDEEDEDEGEDGGANDAQTLPERIPNGKPSSSSKSLDPLAAIRESRQKDVEKGKAIKQQKQLFESLITLRITYQKALTATSKLPFPLPSDPSGELPTLRETTLNSLAELSEKLFELRKAIALPGVEVPEGLGKRKRDVMEEEYWVDTARDSLELVDLTRPQMIPILTKWSSKITAASLQLGSKQAGGSKFLQGTKDGSGGIIEAIEASIAAKTESDQTLLESEETAYRALLREVIETRSGGNAGADLSHLRKEKKKKREEERGGSKGRKLRYTVHEKAQNFVVPITLQHSWHDEQIDELFGSLFGGAGIKGAVSEGVTATLGDGLASLGGLRVF